MISLIDRLYGHYPVSIATSLALEGLFHTGDYSDWQDKLVADDYQRIFLNIRTLFRNAFEAFGDHRQRLTPDVLVESILEDIHNFTAAATAAAPHLLCVPYFCEYKSVNRTFPSAVFRNANTPNQVFFNSLEKDVYLLLDKMRESIPAFTVFDVYPEGDKETLMLTHYPCDLLAYKRFPKLGLLESHSGKVKTQLEWYTKMYNKPAQIPFNKPFLVLFGDHVMFSPQDRKVRNVLLKTADKYDWSQTTTMDRIYNCLRLVNEPHVIAYLRKLSQ